MDLSVPSPLIFHAIEKSYDQIWNTTTVSKRGTQKIERKHLTLRARIKRLVRKTICFSKSTQMHDIVIGLFVNRYAFGRAV
jgi:IS1 family transposase